jgi:transposase
MVQRIGSGRAVAHVAAEMGISRTTAWRWWRRFREHGPAGLVDRSSVARSHPRRTAACVTGTVIRARRRSAERYEHDHPGSLIHVDVKKLGRIPDGGGWRLHGRGERPNRKRGL